MKPLAPAGLLALLVAAAPCAAATSSPAELGPAPGIAGGRFEELTIESRAMGGPRRVVVWVPAGLTARAERVPALYLLDGPDDRELGKVHVVAADLIGSGKLPPFLLVLVPPDDRGAEYGRNRAFERFLVTELVPAVEARWPARTHPAGRGVLGVALGAVAARSVTARHPDVFGLVPPAADGGTSWTAYLAEALTFFWGDAQPPARDGPRALAAPPEGASRFTGAPVSLDVKDADLGEVVRTLTSGRGLSVVSPPDFRGTVTASLRDVPWDQALDLVLAGNGWAFVREGTVVRIFRRSPGPG